MIGTVTESVSSQPSTSESVPEAVKPAPQEPEDGRNWIRRPALAAGVLVIAGLLAICGTFGELRVIINDTPGVDNAGRPTLNHSEMHLTSWTEVESGWKKDGSGSAEDTTVMPSSSRSHQYGGPLVAGGLLAVLAALMVLRGRSSLSVRLSWSRFSAAGAAGTLVSAVWLLGVTVVGFTDDDSGSYGPVSADHVGVGWWVLGASAVIAVLGCGLLWLLPSVSRSERAPESHVSDVVVYELGPEVETPPYGFPIPESR